MSRDTLRFKIRAKALIITTVMWGRKAEDNDLPYTVEEVLREYIGGLGWSNARKADLYARIVESLEATMHFPAAVHVVAKAIYQNYKAFGG